MKTIISCKYSCNASVDTLREVKYVKDVKDYWLARFGLDWTPFRAYYHGILIANSQS
jgi:hypothetical protein